MFELLTETGNLPVDGIGWMVFLASVLLVVVWLLYLYR